MQRQNADNSAGSGRGQISKALGAAGEAALALESWLNVGCAGLVRVLPQRMATWNLRTRLSLDRGPCGCG